MEIDQQGNLGMIRCEMLAKIIFTVAKGLIRNEWRSKVPVEGV